MRIVKNTLACVCISLAATAAIAQPYPTRQPITIVVGYAAGGGLDIVARQVAERLSKKLGQAVVVDNRAGAAGNIGSEYVVRARPDGYTLLMSNLGSLAAAPALYKNLNFDPGKDLVPISRVVIQQLVATVPASLPIKDGKEAVQLFKNNPGKYSYASSGSGSIQQLAVETIQSRTGWDLIHIPYKAGGAAIPDLIAGRVHLMIDGTQLLAPMIKDGRLKPIFVPATKRAAVLPDVPTAAEVGLPDMSVFGWQGLLAPKGTPREIVDKLDRAIADLMKEKDFQDHLWAQGTEPSYQSSKEFADFMAAERSRWADLIQRVGIKLD